MQDYPNVQANDLDSALYLLRYITKQRPLDISDFTNLPNIYLSGRKSGKIPTSSTDISGDRVGDINYTATFLYIVVDNGGTAAWRRVALSAF